MPKMSYLQRIKQSKLSKWKSIDLLYEFEMDFCVERINRAIDQFMGDNDLNDGDYLPSWFVIDAYKQQDLIIALKEQLLKTPESWTIGIDSHFYNAETEQVHTIPFALELPAMEYHSLMNGCDTKVAIVDGLKTIKGNWQGLQKEMISNWERQGVPDGYELTLSQVKITAQAHFKDMACFEYFEKLCVYRKAGKLVQFLKGLEVVK